MKDKDRLMLTSVLVAVALVASVITGVIGALNLTRIITSKGRIVIVTPPPPPELKLTVFADAECTTILSEIDWGSFDPGEAKTVNAYVKNHGDVPFNMTMTTDNWVPLEASSYITASWDYNGQTVSVGEVLPVIFSLEVGANAVEGNFSHDIIIWAEEA